MNTKIPMSEATDEQLRQFARTSLQLDIHRQLGRSKVLAAMAPAYNEDFIIVAEDPAPTEEKPALAQDLPTTPVAQVRKVVGGRAENDPKVLLTIGHGSLVGGRSPAQVSVNGRMIVIQRGIKVEVPYRYYLALVEARRGESLQDQNSGEIIDSEVTNYPLTVHRMPSDDEIKAWEDVTRDVEIA